MQKIKLNQNSLSVLKNGKNNLLAFSGGIKNHSNLSFNWCAVIRF
jgi:hypothetical protein